MSNKFKFYAPVEIKKSKDAKGVEVMKVGGIASTSDEDSDGEFLDPNGFILDDFLTTGFINWHHQSKNKPKTIVGEPSLAEIRPDGLYVECLLYPSSDIAKEIYETAEILERDSKTRRLGFSIEGEVLERESDDENDPAYNKIKKANITGLAITHMPKNAATFAQIIKGFVGGEGSIEDSGESDDSEGLNTKNGKAIIKESLDKKIKKVNQFTQNIVKSKYEIIDLDKEKMIYKIFNTFTDINIEKAEKVFMLLTKISHDMKKDKINDDNLEKAMSALGLNIDEANPFLQKAKDDDSDEDSEDDDDEKVKAAAKKVADKVQKEEFGESDKGGKEVKKAESDEDANGDDKEDESEKIEKSKSATTIGGNNGLVLLMSKEIQKAKSQSTLEARALGVLIKGVLDENQLLKGHIEKQNDFFERQSNMIDEQTELIKALSGKLEMFGEVPNARKAITKGFTEKFEESTTTVEKGSNTLSKSKDRGKILEVLDIRSFAKGFDEEFSKACMSFEASGEISPAIEKRLQLETGITITQ